jgi:drug/metabolite transporter (DMT)-like permease
VNPVVAVALGYFFGGEAVGPRMLLGSLLVLVSVAVITTTPKKKLERVSLAQKAEMAEP